MNYVRGVANTLNLSCFVIVCFSGCADANKPEHKEKLPFIGTRYFETRPYASGRATPHRKVEIREDGTVKFSYEQENTVDNIIADSGSYIAGPFQKIMTCKFTGLIGDEDHYIRYYEIAKDTIHETDSNGVRLTLEDCCGLSDSIDICPCSAELWDDLTW